MAFLLETFKRNSAVIEGSILSIVVPILSKTPSNIGRRICVRKAQLFKINLQKTMTLHKSPLSIYKNNTETAMIQAWQAIGPFCYRLYLVNPHGSKTKRDLQMATIYNINIPTIYECTILEILPRTEVGNYYFQSEVL